MSFSNVGMVLAAGYGKRMLPLTQTEPKPLLNINGITLLENSINFLIKLGCKKIIINTHYLNNQIESFIDKSKEREKIITVYEKEILDTGGGIKNIIPHINSKNLLVINSDVFWTEKNLYDAKLLINNFDIHNNSSLLLSNKKNSYGLDKMNGDFIINDNKIIRYSKGDEIIFYSGLQILNVKSIKNFSEKKFSINLIWDILINKGELCGELMKSKLFHVGDPKGLSIVKKLFS
ncbi:nucleotidyltransferase family protein [Alphaproteobacteria bacterium]|nr:nucleotidyltransferase family protein [Alphaproteobacteria bacterium]